MARIQESWIDFILTYFKLWPSLACHLVVLAFYHYMRGIFSDELSTTLTLNLVISVVFSLVVLLSVHTLITKAGHLYINSKINMINASKTGIILENLQEGVAIIAEDNHEIMYLNKALQSLANNHSTCNSIFGGQAPKPDF